MTSSLLAAFVWNADPELFSFGPFHIRWYGLFFALSFLIGYEIMVWVFRREKKPLSDLDSLLIYMIAGTILGARLGHCLFYESEYYLANPLQIIAVWRGGLASHGGAVGVCLAVYLYSRKRPEQPFLWTLSRTALTVPLAGFFIRTGNFFNSEIIGRAADVPWAVIFVPVDSVPRHPAMLYEAASYLVLFVIMLRLYERGGRFLDPRFILGIFFTGTFGARFLIEFTKEVQASFENALPLHMGQLLSIPLVAIGLLLLGSWASSEHEKEGAQSLK